MNLSIEFGGGIDSLIINNYRTLHIVITPTNTSVDHINLQITIGNLLAFIRSNLTLSQPNLFASQPIKVSKGASFDIKISEINKTYTLDTSATSTPTPGIIILVNETDYELLGGVDYKLSPNQNIAIISTLHGG